jgi:hypothetical protein
MIDWQTQFLTLVLIFTKDPGSKPPRTLSELYGPDLNRTLLFHQDRYCEPTCSYAVVLSHRADERTAFLDRDGERFFGADILARVAGRAADLRQAARQHARWRRGPGDPRRHRLMSPPGTVTPLVAGGYNRSMAAVSPSAG